MDIAETTVFSVLAKMMSPNLRNLMKRETTRQNKQMLERQANREANQPNQLKAASQQWFEVDMLLPTVEKLLQRMSLSFHLLSAFLSILGKLQLLCFANQ